MRERCVQRLIRQCDEAWGAVLNLALRLTAWALPRHGTTGRMMRSRGVWRRPRLKPFLALNSVPHVRHIFQDFDPETDALILGNSHPYHALNPASATRLRFWNASLIAADAWFAYHTYLALRAKWPKRPGQIVLFGDDYWLTSHQTEYTRMFFPLAVCLHVIAGMPYRNAFLTRGYDRMARRALRLIDRSTPSPFHRGHFSFADTVAQDVPAIVREHLRKLTRPATEVPWLLRLREAVEADGRRLVLLRTPHRSDYLEALAAAKQDIWFQTAPFRQGLPLLDHFTLQPPTPTCFVNSDHLSPEGAAWFTPIVERDLIRLNIHQ